MKYMIHKPCGANNVNAPCMQLNRETNRKRCNKHFLNRSEVMKQLTISLGELNPLARVKSTNVRPTVRNFVDGKWTNVPVGDEWVASCNPYLLMRFDCHVHVDVVTATACVKYLFKNVHKGEDYAKARMQGITDEIEPYRKTMYISATEATRRLLGFQLVDRNPAVTKIHAHLEGCLLYTSPSPRD